MEEGSAAVAEDAMSRFSLDASAGGRHSTLLDEYERLAFEAQLNRAIVLRRCYSEPSPVRVAQPPPPPPQRKPADDGGDARAGRGGGSGGAPPGQEGEPRRRDGGGGGGRGRGRLWRLHEVLSRWLEALRPVFRWLSSAWERRRRKDDEPADANEHAHAARRPPPTVPRVQLLDYLR